MSTVAQCVSGYGQGTDTTSVLTNRSKYITIIADEPYFSRHSRTFPPARHRKGTRPMHTTTLTYEVKPVKTSYISCMKVVCKYSILTAQLNRCAMFKFHTVFSMCEAGMQTQQSSVYDLELKALDVSDIFTLSKLLFSGMIVIPGSYVFPFPNF